MAFFEQKLQKLLFTRKEQRAFLEDISALIKDGVPAPQAINTVYEIAQGPTKEVAKAILKSISEGQKIADGMDGWFPQSVVEIVRAGEEGGALTKTMGIATESLAQQASALTSILSSIAYPLTVVVVACAVVVFLKHSVFENFANIKPVASWPKEGKFLMNAATFLEHWWWLILALIIAAGVAIKRMLSDVTGELRKIIDSIPVLSLYRGYMAARFMSTLGMLLTNGIGFKQALFILQRNAGRYLAWHIYLMQYRLSAGHENIAQVLNTGMVWEDDVLRLLAMAKGKGFENALLSLGKHSAERNLRNIIMTGKIMGFIFLISAAGMAIFIVFALYGVGSFIGT